MNKRREDSRSFFRVRGRIRNCTEWTERSWRPEDRDLPNPDKDSVREAPRNGLEESDDAILATTRRKRLMGNWELWRVWAGECWYRPKQYSPTSKFKAYSFLSFFLLKGRVFVVLGGWPLTDHLGRWWLLTAWAECN